MNNQSFYQFIIREITKNSLSRMNLPTFTRLIRKKAQDVSSAQLLYLYRELERLKSNCSQFHMAHGNNNHSEKFKSNDSKTVMKYESYEKHTLICLEQIAIKLKEKNGYEEGVDLCKLSYYRLLNAIDYHLPFAHILDQFREQFLWKSIQEDVIDYVELITKDPSDFGPQFVEIVNTIIKTVEQELDNIDILQFPYLKNILSKGQAYREYNIEESLLQQIDKIINQNKYAFTFGELESCLRSDLKDKDIHEFYSLMTKDPIEKRLNYLYIDSKNMSQHSKVGFEITLKSRLSGLPGRNIIDEFIEPALKKISDLSLYGVYFNIFDRIQTEQQFSKSLTLRQYIKYHFQYFSKSGNIYCKQKQIILVLKNTLADASKMKAKGIKYNHLQILKLFYILSMLSRKQINYTQICESHAALHQELEGLHLIQKPKVENLNKIFDQSSKYFSFDLQNLEQVKQIFEYVSLHIINCGEKGLTDAISEEIQNFCHKQKSFMINQLILWIVNMLRENVMLSQVESMGKMLDIVAKIQFKKFSQESSNIQKILTLIQQKKNSSKRDSEESSGGVKQTQINQKTHIKTQLQEELIGNNKISENLARQQEQKNGEELSLFKQTGFRNNFFSSTVA